MKRKVVITMSLAYWADDKYFYEPINSNEDVLTILRRDCTEADYLDFMEEASVIKVEITEVKE